MCGTKALQNQDLSEKLHESEALFQISQMLARSIDLPTILSQIVDATASLIPNAEQSVIHLTDDSNTMLRPVAVARPDTTGTSPLFFRPGEGIAGRVISEGITINVTDTLLDERFLPQDHGSVVYRSLLVAPIKLHEQIIGTLSVESYSPGAFSDYYVRVLTSMGEQAALAIERAQILQEEQEQRQLAEALREASNIQGSETDLQSVLGQILHLIHKVLPYDYASVMMIEDGYAKTALTVKHQSGDAQDTNDVILDTSSFEISKFPELKTLIESSTPTIIKDTSEIDEWKNVFADSLAWVGVPIHAQGKVIALISLQKKETGFYEPKHVDRLSAFASQASLTIQNAQLFETIQRNLREVNFLYQISQKLAESLETILILRQVSELLRKQFGFYHVQFLLLDQSDEGFLIQQVVQPPNSREAETHIRVKQTGIPGYVAETNQPYYSNNVQSDKRYIFQSHLADTVAELAIPLRTGDRLYGVLDIHHKAPNSFKQDDLQLLFTIAEQISLAIEKSAIYDDLQTTLSKELAARAQLVQSEKLAALGRIVASVAHELNNPLQAIQNALYLINLEDNLNEQAREDIDVALNEADRMADLISRLRETYRPTTREEFQSCSINNLVVDVEKLIGTHLRRNEITFHFTPGENIPDCSLIQDQIKQVILNISLNAVESMPNGGTLTITTQLEPETNQVRLDICDSGAGIPKDVLPYIFDPFVTTKDRGTGLGLAITYDIVSRHGGRIEPESQPGQGTTFHVWLPVEM